jgi:hypothetical protein
MDIVYSVTCHEDPESFMDFLRNIIYFNKDLKILIVIHSNHFMFNELIKKINNTNVYLNENILDKRRGTIDVSRGHIENFGLCKQNKITMKYFIPLASNCYFSNFVTVDFIDKLILDSNDVDYTYEVNSDHYRSSRTWQWDGILKNNKINTCLQNEGVNTLFGGQHEGLILNETIMDALYNFTYKYNIFNIVESNTFFEEYLFTSFYTKITRKMPQYVCLVFWEMPGYRPTFDQMLTCNKPCFKSIQRNINDEFRVYFNKKTNNYEGVKID